MMNSSVGLCWLLDAPTDRWFDESLIAPNTYHNKSVGSCWLLDAPTLGWFDESLIHVAPDIYHNRYLDLRGKPTLVV